jgi:hypothetical protein
MTNSRMDDMKCCKRCGNLKESGMFHRDRNRKSGIRDVCKSCTSVYLKQYRKQPTVVKHDRVRAQEYSARPEVVIKRKENHNRCMSKEDSRYKKCESSKAYNHKKIAESPEYKLIFRLRSRTCEILKSAKSKSTIEYLGCNANFLKRWIEFRFDKTMNWDNWGTKWHGIDRVDVCSQITR